MRKLLLLTLLLISSTFAVSAEDTPLTVLRAAISDLENRVPGIGYPQSWQHTYMEVATTDSSLGCAMVPGDMLAQPVIAYQVTLTYEMGSYQYMVADDGSLVVPCDVQLLGGDLPQDNNLAVGGPSRQPDIEVSQTADETEADDENAEEDLFCEVTAIRANIRRQPTIDATVIGELVTGERLQVITRTDDADTERFWWQLASGGYVASWVTTEIGEDCEILAANGMTTADDDAITVTCEGALTPRLQPGDTGRVVSGLPNNMRSDPSLQARLIGQIWHGRTFEVLDGPLCVDGLAWYEVQYANTVGWTAEGNSVRYWLRPMSVEDAQ